MLGFAGSTKDGKPDRGRVTPYIILAAVNKHLAPYTLDYVHCEWWAAYQREQGVAADSIDASGRIFLAGDAVHTHSPQAGQGLKVSLADTQDLVWKLNLVAKRLARPEILQTYREERLAIARDVIDLDPRWRLPFPASR